MKDSMMKLSLFLCLLMPTQIFGHQFYDIHPELYEEHDFDWFSDEIRVQRVLKLSTDFEQAKEKASEIEQFCNDRSRCAYIVDRINQIKHFNGNQNNPGGLYSWISIDADKVTASFYNQTRMGEGLRYFILEMYKVQDAEVDDINTDTDAYPYNDYVKDFKLKIEANGIKGGTSVRLNMAVTLDYSKIDYPKWIVKRIVRKELNKGADQIVANLR